MGRSYLKCKFLLWLNEVIIEICWISKSKIKSKKRAGSRDRQVWENEWQTVSKSIRWIGMTGTPKKKKKYLSKHSMQMVAYDCFILLLIKWNWHRLCHRLYWTYLMFAIICSICFSFRWLCPHMPNSMNEINKGFILWFISLNFRSVSIKQEPSRRHSQRSMPSC